MLVFEWTHSEVAKLSSSSSDTTDALSPLLALINIKRCRQNKSKAAILVDGMWDNDFLDGEAQQYTIERVCPPSKACVYSMETTEGDEYLGLRFES
jgi:hypothetical protein